jgi:hypothetical protein
LLLGATSLISCLVDLMSGLNAKPRVEGACATIKDWVAREKQCSGEQSEVFEREFREWLEGQAVGAEFGHCEGSEAEQVDVEHFLWVYKKGRVTGSSSVCSG